MSAAKQKGTDFEVMCLPRLRDIWPEAERRAQTGKNDKGDYHLPGEKRLIIEAKNRTQLALQQWLREAEVEAKNAGVPYGVVLHKRKGSRVPGEQYVTMTLDVFLALCGPQKWCKDCDTSKPVTEFYWNGERHVTYCKPCHQVRAKQSNERNPERRAEVVRASRLRTSYGLEMEDYEALLGAQGGVCAICEGDCPSGKRLAVDHDHGTGKVRGLLCANCNRALGLMQDEPDLLRRAATYLDTFLGLVGP